MKITKLNCDRQAMSAYLAQNNVIRRTNMSACGLNYGKIVVFSDADKDGQLRLTKNILLNFKDYRSTYFCIIAESVQHVA